MHARALAVALRLLSLACAGAALGSLTACPIFYDCGDAWSEPEDISFGTQSDLINVGAGTEYDSFVAVGLGGLISTVNGDVSNPQSPVNVALRGLARRETRLLAVGDQGTILVSDDSGETWLPRTSGTTNSLIAIVHAPLTSGDYLVAVGVESIVVSMDLGDTWLVVTEPATGWGTLRGVFATGDRVYAVGDGGVAWSSAAPNGLWNTEMLGTTADLLGGGATFADPGYPISENDILVVAAADNSVLLRDGATWTVHPLELDGDLIGISGGYLLTSTGAVYDLDGGGLAIRLAPSFDFAVKAIHGDSSGVIVVGEAGQAQRIWYQPCIGGRPLVDEGRSVVAGLVERDDWSEAKTESADELDEAAAARWARAGLDEHASVGSFAVHVLELASLGAPAELLAEAARAMADEVRHASLCFELAHRFGGVARGPGPLAITPTMLARCGDPRAIALALFEQGCVNETIAACEASVAAQTCEDPEARRVLEQLAADERGHAALAWKSLRWLIDQHPTLRESLRGRLRRLAASGATELEQQTLRELILPLARTLLGTDEAERAARALA